MYVQYLYNIFARILNILINRLNERDFEKMRNIKKDYENTILLKLKDKFPDLFDKETLNVAKLSEFLITKYLRILAEVLKVNLLLVPSFTSGDYQFESLSFKYPELDWCVIWVNACSSRWLNERGTQSAHVFMAYMAGRQGIITEKISMDDLCGGEERCCQGCTHVYRIKFDEEVRI